MSKRLTILGAIAAVVLLVCAGGALAKPVKIDIGPTTTWNECTGELVELSGTIRFNEASHWQDAAGGWHYTRHITGSFKGNSLANGIEYVANITIHDSFHLEKSESFTFTHSVTFISKGPAPNMVCMIMEHATVNANGDVAVYFVFEECKCVGAAD